MHVINPEPECHRLRIKLRLERAEYDRQLSVLSFRPEVDELLVFNCERDD